ncbi:MAG TPA: SDR family oxidoreductase [Solirubrobacteraceae bacterium]|nr:SDR family oxidoreductase [Solirubrobacteraceae bacterium]
MKTQIVVVIGAGGIGLAIARRQGTGRAIVLADLNQELLARSAAALQDSGHVVATQPVDISSRASVQQLADRADAMGDIMNVIVAAGVSPVQASKGTVIAVDLVGTAIVLEEFARVIAPGGAGVVIASMAGHMLPALTAEQDYALAFTPTDALAGLEMLSDQAVPNSGAAYALAKRANVLRVQAAAVAWGDRAARLNTISPGIVITPLARDEMSGPGAEGYRRMIENSAARRPATTDEIATVAALLLGADGAFITGSDLLIDGGVIAALRAGRWTLSL